MMYKLGIIGGGAMASAIASGIISAGLYKASEIIISDINESSLEKIKAGLQAATTTDNTELARNSDIVLLAVKPQIFKSMDKTGLSEAVRDKLLISIMAGIDTGTISEALSINGRLARVMPNTAALVGHSMSAVCFREGMSERDRIRVWDIFRSIGEVMEVPEELFDAVTALSGSSPAYVFVMLEAMADAGVSLGLGRMEAYALAANAISGAGLMYLEGNRHPAELKDMVCSPAGTTIEAVRELEKRGFRSAVIEAVRVCADRSRELRENN